MQETITHIIVLSAAGYTVWQAVKLFLPDRRKKRGYSICGSCEGCSLNGATTKGSGKT